MKKNKGNEIVKTVTASVLSIGMFSALFIGANNLAFASASSKTESISPITTPVSVSATVSTPPENYQRPKITVYEDLLDGYYTKNPNAISMEEAANIGAFYIWDVLGENIDGKTVEMTYTAHPYSTRTHWFGMVADSKSDMDNRNLLFMFNLDAISGERIDIDRVWELTPSLEDKTITYEELQALMKKYRNSPEELDDFEECTQIAKEYAQKHFTNTNVVSAVYDNLGLTRTKRNADINQISYGEKVIIFKVTDDTGREASVSIAIESKQLLHLSTQENDIVPGFNAELPGSVG